MNVASGAAAGFVEAAPSAPRIQPASIHDVARLAGVSTQTVSRALNGHPNVRRATRGRVLAAAEQLRFRPNRAARVLRGGRSRTLGVLAVAAGAHYGPAMSIAAFEEAARERGHDVIVVRAASAARQAVAAAARDLLGHNVDGALVVAPGAAWLSGLPGLLAHLPVVAPRCGPQHPASVTYPSIDQRAGVGQLISHLVARGHRRVLHLAGPPGWDDAESRLHAYKSELRRAGLPSLPPLFGDWSAASGYAAGRALLKRRSGGELGFSAVFAANDQMALGLLRALHEAGIEVPRDVSVAGFDDIPQAAYFWPPLTTVRQDFGELGRRQVTALLAGRDGGADGAGVADGADGAEVEALEPLLVVRSSVTAAP